MDKWVGFVSNHTKREFPHRRSIHFNNHLRSYRSEEKISRKKVQFTLENSLIRNVNTFVSCTFSSRESELIVFLPHLDRGKKKYLEF